MGILEGSVCDALAKHNRNMITVMVYFQLVRGYLFQQDHRMASLELQSTSKAGKCLFSLKTDNKIPKIYVIIFAYI